MLCSSSVPSMSIDQGLHHDATLAHSSTTSHHHRNSNNTSRTSSPSTPTTARSNEAQASTSTLPTRPRHHVRSFSTESRFTPPQNLPAQASTSASNFSTPAESFVSPSIVIDPSSPPLSLPTRAKKQPSPPMSLPSDQPAYTYKALPPSSPQSHSPSPPRGNDSPSKRSISLEDAREQERLNSLKEQQANRRPRMMRLTPAYSSTPVKLPSPLSKAIGKKGATLLTKSASQDASPKSVQFPGVVESEQEPGVGLQIDLGCIPTPSLQDLKGPISTSQLDGLVRDRNGNPIKPSLKSPRSSVSHFLPGRTVRSDSTPTLPSSMHSKSVPSTPSVAKAVHFDSKLEHVKVFKFKQRPTAVSRDGSPEQTETETEEEKDQFPYIWRKNSNNNLSDTSAMHGMMSPSSQFQTTPSAPMPEMEEQLVLRLPNFPSSTRLSVDREIFLERIFLAEDLRSVKGTVQVRNMSFEKWVAIRYTLDHWATIGEVSAEYSETIKGGQADRFTFSIKLNELLNWPRGSAAHETKSMFMCLRYTVNEAEFWDNNDGLNYQLDFRKRQVPSTPLSTPTAAHSTTIVQPRATVPDSIANGAAARSKVFDLARKVGVGGRGVFAMEDLKRELDKLRSDEEVDEEAPVASRSFALELAKKRGSPPSSPGARSSSPSVWTARYDFGQSLRNPRSGSRSTGLGRAAALDYFSAKPMARTGSNSRESGTEEGSNNHGAPSSNSLATSMLVDKFEQMTQAAKNSPDFSHKFGMISPGLGDGNIEHKPLISGSNTPSADPSPSPTPLPEDFDQSPITSNRFHSYPPNRRNGATTPTPTSSGRMTPNFFTPTEEYGSSALSRSTSQDLLNPATVLKRLEDGDASGNTEYYSPSASSSISDYGSPNPFSPVDSISSTESDVTVANLATPEDRQTKAKMIVMPIHARQSFNGSSTSTTSLDNISHAGGLASIPIPPPISLGMPGKVEAEPLRPASMSDYQELVSKYCWNSDLVPSGGSTIPDMPMHGGLAGSTTLQIEGQSLSRLSPNIKSPALSSGGSTPTIS